MSGRNNKLRLSNVNGFLSQITEDTSIDTIIKLKTRAANCLFNAGDKKNLNTSLKLYNEVYELQFEFRGPMNPRTLNIAKLIMTSEQKLKNLRCLKMSE
mgnify:CR=1 FL=1|jgi:hypothetical protein